MNITEAKWLFGGFYGMVSNKVLALRWTKYKHSAVIRTAPLIWPYVRHFQRLVHIKEMRKYWISVTPLVLSREAYGNVGKNGKWNKGNMEPPAWSPKWELRIEEKLVSFFGIWGRERERGEEIDEGDDDGCQSRQGLSAKQGAVLVRICYQICQDSLSFSLYLSASDPGSHGLWLSAPLAGAFTRTATQSLHSPVPNVFPFFMFS